MTRGRVIKIGTFQKILFSFHDWIHDLIQPHIKFAPHTNEIFYGLESSHSIILTYMLVNRSEGNFQMS